MSISGVPGGLRSALNITSTTPLLIYSGAARIARLVTWAGTQDGYTGLVYIYDAASAADAGTTNLIGQFATGGLTTYELDWPILNGIVVNVGAFGSAAPGASLSFTVA